MQIIGMQISIDDYPGRFGSWHRAGRSRRLAVAGVRSWFWSYRSRQEPGAEREESRNETMISGVKVQLKEKQDRRKGGKGVPVYE